MCIFGNFFTTASFAEKSSSSETPHFSKSFCKEIPKQTAKVLLHSVLSGKVYNLSANTSGSSRRADNSLPATYLQPQSLRHHPYVDANKHYSLGAVGLCHDEGSAVEACEEPTAHLVRIGVTHLEGKSSVRPTQTKYWEMDSFACIFLSQFPEDQKKKNLSR